ncbi:metal-dependent transcriptional regulator [Leucobacter musarum]|uniref:metal-dependent transcriptional regulator n=1 Tax=Leucobacter musarum TaxID=1930747 RepID=UPI0006A7BC22
MGRVPRPVVTRMVEDYLTLVWKAYEWPGGEPSTTDLAEQLGVTPSTVSANLKKLARDGFLAYEPYGRIELTEAGREVAVAIVRRHRLVETYLVQQLGLGWDEVHDEADSLEHAVSDLVLARMDAVLGHPVADPHGDPIPAPDGSVPADDTVSLVDAEAGALASVARVSDRSPELLRHLESRRIVVGAPLRVVSVAPAAGAVEVLLWGGTDGAASGGERVELSLVAAAAIRLRAREA